MITFYAHSTESENKSEWQTLEEHLLGVAERAANFADAFRAKEWGRCAGLLHDMGKATRAFQRRLEGSLERVDHSTFGARLAKENGGQLGLLLAYVLAGHHGGLPDGGEQETQLHFRLKHGRVPKDTGLVINDDCLGDLSLPFKLKQSLGGFSLSFFCRMLFSCLVDADFLDTEQFCSPQIAAERTVNRKTNVFQVLQKRMHARLEHIVNAAEPSHVNKLRKEILFQCLDKAKLPQQVFSLSVPTGGGKTLSSMAFALDHAIVHGLSRVIYAIPFTSIIEQNAQVFQEILGREQVLEHHCNYKEIDDPEEAAYNRRRGMTAENWESPIVVSTNVQFFESLFSNKPSKCRKLHNIAKSVIVLDEAQAIPTDYLEPCLAALKELVDHYGCTVVLCTATQPAFDDKRCLHAAFPQINEIIGKVQVIVYPKVSADRLPLMGQKFQLIVYLIQ
jgi:CRISPR-associated endonuclease/helicase Cas3